MKRLALVSLFAAALAAQQTPPAPPKAVAAAIAVEEQEGDLGKAERLYRDLLADEQLPAAARSTVNLRLGRLLQKLGKADEAMPFLQAAKGEVVSLDDVTEGFGPQDAEREKALRAEARALLREPEKIIGNGISWDQLSGPLPERLLWLGKPAVPEIIATIENTSLSAEPGMGLFALLWRIGGPQAQAFLERSLGSPTLQQLAAQAANAAPDGAMLAFAGRQVAAIDWPTARVMLVANVYARPGLLENRLPRALLLERAERDTPEVQAYVLDLCRRSGVDELDAARRVVDLVRRGLASTDPALGTAAEKCLASDCVQTCTAGLELLFEVLPARPQVRVPFRGLPVDALEDPDSGRASLAAAQRLWPKAVACGIAMGKEHRSRDWLSRMLEPLCGPLDATIVPDVLTLTDAGFYVFSLVKGRITTTNVTAVLARADRAGRADREELLQWITAVDLPEALFPVLRDLAAAWRTESPDFTVVRFAMPMAHTGAPDAAAWMLACPVPNGWGPPGDALLELARRNRSEPVRAAMRAMLQLPRNTWRTELTLALLSMHDEPTLDLVQPDMGPELHPYAAALPGNAEGERLTPLHYLLYDQPDPPHGFTADEVRRVVTRMGSRVPISPLDEGVARLSAPMLRMLAETVFGSWTMGNGDSRTWQQVAMQRCRASQGKDGWEEWVQRGLATESLCTGILDQLDAAEVERHRTTIEALLEKPETAVSAIAALRRAGREIDIAALLAGDHGQPARQLRYWAFNQVTRGKEQAADSALTPFLHDKTAWVRNTAAQYLGTKVSTEAVPGLIALLRDPDGDVRTTAADALTKIRFFHEQQAHWDRVFKGIDASATSAVEKLLLQAKPDAPKPQRLLAITSLGTLGVPEALPFLIDWTNDADAEIAAAAKAAITQIHLQPRR